MLELDHNREREGPFMKNDEGPWEDGNRMISDP